MPFRTPLDLYQDRLTALDRRRLLRPMTLTETLDSAFRVIQLYGVRILLATIIPTALCYLSLIFFNTFVLPTVFGASSNVVLEQVSEIAIASGILFFNILPLLIIGVSYGVAFTSRVTVRHMLGDKPNLPEIEDESRLAHLGMASTIAATLIQIFSVPIFVTISLIGITILQQSTPNNLILDIIAVTLWTLGTVCAILIPPIVAGKVSLSTSVFVAEGQSGLAASKRSSQLVKGSGFVPSGYASIWGLWLLVAFIDLCIWTGLQGIFSILGIVSYADYLRTTGEFGTLMSGAINALPSFLVLWLTIPVISASLTVLYYDRRVRMEAYDIRILAQDVFKADSSRNTH